MSILKEAIIQDNDIEVKRLLEAGANPNEVDNFGLTPVHKACQARHGDSKEGIKVLYLLLKYGGNPNIVAKGWSASTPLHLAAIKGGVSKLKMLKKFGADFNALNSRGQKPLHNGAMFNGYQEVCYLIKSTGNPNELSKSKITPLQCATSNMNVEAITALYDNGANFNIKDKHGCTPLHHVFSSFKKNSNGKIDLSTIETLIKCGANPNAKDRLGRTPLHYAVKFGSCSMARVLLDSGANIHEKSNMKGHLTPLQLANSLEKKELLELFKLHEKRRLGHKKSKNKSLINLK